MATSLARRCARDRIRQHWRVGSTPPVTAISTHSGVGCPLIGTALRSRHFDDILQKRWRASGATHCGTPPLSLPSPACRGRTAASWLRLGHGDAGLQAAKKEFAHRQLGLSCHPTGYDLRLHHRHKQLRGVARLHAVEACCATPITVMLLPLITTVFPTIGVGTERVFNADAALVSGNCQQK
jgi:hypothetical protein